MNQQTNNLQKKVTLRGTKDYVLTGNAGMSIMDIINSRPDCDYAFPCNGNGKCGKCVIKVLEGYFDITKEDRNFFDDKKLSEGYRLACKAVLWEDCVIEYLGAVEESYEIQSAFVEIKSYEMSEKVSDGAQRACSCDGLHNELMMKAAKRYAVAIDIGTTTIAAALVDNSNGNVVRTRTALNRQRRFGADVIARIQASNDGKGEELRESIIKDLTDCIESVLDESTSEVDLIVISGNTTMEHLLLGYSCETLGVFPFTPVDIKSKTLSFKEVFDKTNLEFMSEVPVYIMPGISTYVGADIAAGILHCDMADNEDVSLLIDLGTNGEMAIGNKDRILVTSTAAGPAFEGGNISCGTGSIDGAICDVKIDENEFDKVEVTTINNAEAAGICGTGVIAVTAELLKNEIVDETGRFDDNYFDDGFLLGRTNKGEEISFTQKDVREIQLAKSAIRAGAETLILRYGIEKSDIKNVYLAGGFGYHIDLHNAVTIGLLPEEFLGRIVAVGNTSLGGAVHVIRDCRNMKKLDKICGMAVEISLSDDRDFQEFYMDYMMFEED